jgi:hypothetical protein
MNFVRIKRLIMHFFVAFYLFAAIVTPVFAVTLDLTSSDNTEIMPLTKPVSLKKTVAKAEIKAEEPQNEQIPTEEKTPATPTPTSAPTPTPTSAPTPTPVATAQPTQAIQTGGNTSTGGLNADVLFSMSNNYRNSIGLASFQTDPRICSLAAARAPQIAAEISGGYMHAGQHSHNFPYWFSENIVTMRTEAEAFHWWINHAPNNIHKQQIESSNTHSCVACSGNACVQHFTSFQLR